MSAAEDQYQIDLINRVVVSQGWTVLVTDRSGTTIRVTIERERPPTHAAAAADLLATH